MKKKKHKIFEIRAIIEVTQAGVPVDKVYIQKEASSELMKATSLTTSIFHVFT
jgi:23S rRNA (guanosine2251-2'-O)-methyltransferase